jgi:hypothetical protein
MKESNHDDDSFLDSIEVFDSCEEQPTGTVVFRLVYSRNWKCVAVHPVPLEINGVGIWTNF